MRELAERARAASRSLSGERPVPGAVAVLDPLALRARRVRALFVCGLQEGVFPARARPQPLLAERGAPAAGRGLGLVLRRARGRPGGRALPALRGGLAPAGAARPELARDRRRRRSRRRARCSSTTSAICSTSACSRRARAPRARRRSRRRAASRRRRADGARAASAAIEPLRDERVLARAGRARRGRRPRWRAGSRCPVALVRRAPAAPRGASTPTPSRSPAAGSRHAALKRHAASSCGAQTGSARLTPGEPRARARAAAPRAGGARGATPAVGSPERLRRARAAALQADLERYSTHAAEQREPARAAPSSSSASASARTSERGEASELPPLDLGGGRASCAGASTASTSAPAARRWCTTTRAATPRAGAKWSGTASCRSRFTCAPPSSCSALRVGRRLLPAAGRQRPARARRARRRRRAWSSSACRTDVRERDGAATSCSTQRIAAAREAAAPGGRGRAASRGRTRCAFRGGCAYPDDLPVRAVSARARRPRSRDASGHGVGRACSPRPRRVRTLTDEQREAVAGAARSRCSLSAAAGSGKTSVLVERFVQAVRDDGVAPGRILAITFTERAAGELRERVRDAPARARRARGGARHRGGLRRHLPRLLRAAAARAPARRRRRPRLSRSSRRASPGACATRAFEDAPARASSAASAPRRSTCWPPTASTALRTMVEQVLRRSCAAAASACPACPRARQLARSDGEDELDVEARAAACALLDELLARFGARLRAAQARARGALDFDDLELLASELLRRARGGARGAGRERFELLMVDEFQDTNPRQLAILRALDRGNLFTVGDELQSIYGFRHADVEPLPRAPRRARASAAASLALTRNFRSRARAARRGQRRLRRALRGASRALERAARATRVPASARGAGQPARRAAADATATAGRRASGWRASRRRPAAARRCGARPRRGCSRSACASWSRRRGAAGRVVVLLRAPGDMEVFERALQLRGLRTLAAVGAFWGHQQIARPDRLPARAGQPPRRGGALRALASPLGRLLARRPGAARRRRPRAGRGVWETALAQSPGGELGAGSPPRRSRRALGGVLRAVRGRARAAPPCRAIADADRAGDRTRPAIASTCSRWTGASGAWRTSTSCCGSRGASRRAKAATCAPSSTTSSTSQATARIEPDAPVDGRRARRRAPDDRARGEGPGVPGRMRRRPRPRSPARACPTCSSTASVSACA